MISKVYQVIYNQDNNDTNLPYRDILDKIPWNTRATLLDVENNKTFVYFSCTSNECCMYKVKMVNI